MEIAPEIRPEFKISKNSWNLGNVVSRQIVVQRGQILAIISNFRRDQ